MNVYDFDETLFYGDSEDRFFQFIFRKKGYFFCKLNYKWNEFKLRRGWATKTETREAEYAPVLKRIAETEDFDKLLEAYWDEVEQYMMPWYDGVKKPDDIIASGTPRFIMEPIVRRLGLKNLVATEMDRVTGKCTGKFAVAEAKLVNFELQYDCKDIDNFYSDAYSDHFIADKAKKAWLIYEENGERKQMEWNEYFRLHPEKAVIPYKR
ncbi:MAG: HAD family hydrolase [Clostridia bacterium]|nr:HAD family hydrolase [Clostridia bacterium]